MSNIKKLNDALGLLGVIDDDLQEMLDLIQAEETHGSVNPAREDDYATAQEAIQKAVKALEAIEHLL